MSTIRRRQGSYGSIYDSRSEVGRDEVDSLIYEFQDGEFFYGSEQKLPWKTICFVMFFLIVGTVSFSLQVVYHIITIAVLVGLLNNCRTDFHRSYRSNIC